MFKEPFAASGGTAQVMDSDPLLVRVPDQVVGVPLLVKDGIIERAASSLGFHIDDYVEMLLSRPTAIPYMDDFGGRNEYRCICPHPVQGNYGIKPTFGQLRRYGKPVFDENKQPVPEKRVMVIGKTPNAEEMGGKGFLPRLFGYSRGGLFKKRLEDAGVDYSNWIMTNACWWYVAGKNVPAIHFREWLHCLGRTVNSIKPEFVLLFGKDALKSFTALFDPKRARDARFTDLRGSTMSFPNSVKAQVAIHPGNVFVDPSVTEDFNRDVDRFARLVSGDQDPDASRPPDTILEIDNQADLENLVDRLIAQGEKRFAVDCEWGNGDWTEGKLRTIQIAWGPGQAMVIILRRAGLVPAFGPSIHAAVAPLLRLFHRPGVGVVGHNFRGDHKWLLQYGIDLTEQFIMNGFDTMLGHHLLYETASHQLEIVALQMLNMPRYDLELRQWKKANKLDKSQTEELGYGTIPDHILHPYAGMDAIATWELDVVIRKEMDAQKGLKELYYGVVHLTNLPLLEMEQNGVLIDMARVRELVTVAKYRGEELIEEVRRAFRWPEMNPRSSIDLREVIFNWHQIKDGKPFQKSGPGVKHLTLTPVKSTASGAAGKSTPWERVLQEEDPAKQRQYVPSTDAESLGILASECPDLEVIRQFKVVDQLRKNFLREEVEDEDTGELDFEKGVGSWVDSTDGRLRTTFRQTLETGRYASSPNLQNWPKKQEGELKKCFMKERFFVSVEGHRYEFKSDSEAVAFAENHGKTVERVTALHSMYHSLRSCLISSPGHVLVEPDWNQAELWTLGACAKDKDFLHTLATSDLHTEMLVKMFGTLNYEGRRVSDISVKELNKLRKQKEHKKIDEWRTAAKTVNFGIPYQRGAGAIVRAVMKEGVKGYVNADAQAWIDTFYQTYPLIFEFLEKCKSEVLKPGYLVNAYGRRRHFFETKDSLLLAAWQREACNFPIQSTVGDAMSVALCNLLAYKLRDRTVNYRLLLSIHDAVLMEVPVEHVARVVEDVIPSCMVKDLEVPGLNLHYSIGDIDIQTRWGDPADPHELLDIGVPRYLCGFKDKK